MDDIARKKDYEESANEYWRWKDAGDNLLIAANILEGNYKKSIEEANKTVKGKLPLSAQILSQWIYFKAKSLELYLKALYIKQGAFATDCKGNLSKILITHNLFTLGNKTKIALSEEQISLLNKLTDAVKYWGTYPIPLFYKKWRPDVDGITGIQPIFIWSQHENKILEEIIFEIRQTLNK